MDYNSTAIVEYNLFNEIQMIKLKKTTFQCRDRRQELLYESQQW